MGFEIRCEARRRRGDRDSKGVEARGMEMGVPFPSRLRDPEEHRKLPQRGPGRSQDKNGFWCILNLKEPMW